MTQLATQLLSDTGPFANLLKTLRERSDHYARCAKQAETRAKEAAEKRAYCSANGSSNVAQRFRNRAEVLNDVIMDLDIITTGARERLAAEPKPESLANSVISLNKIQYTIVPALRQALEDSFCSEEFAGRVVDKAVELLTPKGKVEVSIPFRYLIDNRTSPLEPKPAPALKPKPIPTPTTDDLRDPNVSWTASAENGWRVEANRHGPSPQHRAECDCAEFNGEGPCKWPECYR